MLILIFSFFFLFKDLFNLYVHSICVFVTVIKKLCLDILSLYPFSNSKSIKDETFRDDKCQKFIGLTKLCHVTIIEARSITVASMNGTSSYLLLLLNRIDTRIP